MTEEQHIKNILTSVFPTTHISSTLKYYKEAVEKYQQEDWEGALLKGGKFVESVLKALYVHTGHSLPPIRQFKVGQIVQQLGQSNNIHDDALRLTIPRSCTFIFDIVSNRGTRHDSDEFDPNKMDASVILPLVSWILSELIRFAGQVSNGNDDVMDLTERLMEKKYPLFEAIDGKIYVDRKGIDPKDTGLLLLYAIYPERITRKDLSEAIARHDNFKKNAIDVALTRIKYLVDDGHDGWKLRGIGRQEATKLLVSNL